MDRGMTLDELFGGRRDTRQNGKLQIIGVGLVSISAPKIARQANCKRQRTTKGGGTNAARPEQTQKQAQK